MKLSETMTSALLSATDYSEIRNARRNTLRALESRGLIELLPAPDGSTWGVLTGDGLDVVDRLRAEEAAEEAHQDAEPESMHLSTPDGTLCGKPGPDTAGTGHVDCEGCRELLAAEADRAARGVSLCPVWEVATDECECSDCEALHADDQDDDREIPSLQELFGKNRPDDAEVHAYDVPCGASGGVYFDWNTSEVNCEDCLRIVHPERYETPAEGRVIAHAGGTLGTAPEHADNPTAPGLDLNAHPADLADQIASDLDTHPDIFTEHQPGERAAFQAALRDRAAQLRNPAPLPKQVRASRIQDAIDAHHGVDLDQARNIANALGTAGLTALQSADEDGYLTAGHPASLQSMASKELVQQAEHPAAGGGPRTYRITRLGQTVARLKAAALSARTA